MWGLISSSWGEVYWINSSLVIDLLCMPSMCSVRGRCNGRKYRVCILADDKLVLFQRARYCQDLGQQLIPETLSFSHSVNTLLLSFKFCRSGKLCCHQLMPWQNDTRRVKGTKHPSKGQRRAETCNEASASTPFTKLHSSKLFLIP